MKAKPKEQLSQLQDSNNMKEEDFLSTGITLVNLAMYGRTTGGISKGKMYRIAGRSQTGKTFLARTILAEACRRQSFDDYELIYDDVERGALMDTERFFGSKLVSRLIPPARDKTKKPLHSRYVSDFYKRLNKRLDTGKKVIWIEDSLDSLVPDVGTESKMTDGKARVNSQELRRLLTPLDETGSILILISQVRADMHAGPSYFGPQDIVAGGMAPEFFVTGEIILRKAKTISVKVGERNYPAGYIVQAHIKKNRISGKDRKVYFPFNPEVGLDDVGANVDFLIFTGHWKKDKGKYKAGEFGLECSRDRLVREIEKSDRERELQVLVGRKWREIEEAISKPRKARYT